MRRLAPLCLAAVAVAYIWQTYTIPLDPWSRTEAINARTLPFVYAMVLLAISLGLAIRPPSDSAAAGPTPSGRWRALVLHSLAFVGFGVLIPWAGLWLSLAALLVAGLLIAGKRRPLVLGLAPVVTAGLGWLLIAVLLDVYIDPGRWFS